MLFRQTFRPTGLARVMTRASPRRKAPVPSAGAVTGPTRAVNAAFWMPLVQRAGPGRRAMAAGPGVAELCLWALCLFALTSPFSFTLTGIDPTAVVARNLGTMRRADDSQMLLYAVRVGTLGIALVLALRRWETAFHALPRFLPLMPYLAWGTVTLLWTDSVDTTSHALVAQFCLMLAAFAIGVQLSPRDFARVLVWSGAVMGVFSAIWSVFLPRYGVHQHNDVAQSVHAGAWRGVYLHKNFLGQTAALYAGALFFAGRAIVRSVVVKWGLFAFMLVLIVLSTSVSALAIVPATIFLVWLTLVLGPLQRAMAMLYTGAAAIAGLLSVNAVLAALGRDMTFSGRTTVWGVALTSMAGRPFTGYGFLSITYGDFSYELIRRMGVMDPHNAYFDLILGTGLFGLAVFFWMIAAAWRVARRVYLNGGGDRQAALVIYATFVAWLIASLTEANDRPFTQVGALGFIATSAFFAYSRRRPLLRGPSIEPRRGFGDESARHLYFEDFYEPGEHG